MERKPFVSSIETSIYSREIALADEPVGETGWRRGPTLCKNTRKMGHPPFLAAGGATAPLSRTDL